MKATHEPKVLAVCLFTVAVFYVMSSAVSDLSLWGRKAEFLKGPCITGFWQLVGGPVPPLTELSVCVALRRRMTTARWTAFVYRHPGATQVELGLTGCGGQLHVWVLGVEWTVLVDLPVDCWHGVCLTWSGSSGHLQLFINSSLVFSTIFNGSKPTLTPGGSLTLGAAHGYANEGFYVETGSNFLGDISLFRMWGRELSAPGCEDGDVIRWDTRDWDHHGCPAVPDDNLQCAWSTYIIHMSLGIVYTDGKGIDVNSAQAITCHWLNTTFPRNVSFHTISISSVSQSRCHEPWVQDVDKVQGTEAEKNLIAENCFETLVYISVSPSADVRGVQDDIARLLGPPFIHHLLVLAANSHSVHVVPIDISQTVTNLPPRVTSGISIVDSSCWIPPSETFYRVSLNATVFGTPAIPEECIQTWIWDALTGDGMNILNFVMLSQPPRLLITNKSTGELEKTPVVNSSSYGCSFQLQAVMLLNVSETQHLILTRLTENYSSGTVTVHSQPSDIRISHIEPGFCHQQTQQTRRGLYFWPETGAQQVASLPCESDPMLWGNRSCVVGADTDLAEWNPPVLDSCPLTIISIADLEEVNVTANNSADVLDIVADLIGNETHLSPAELNVVLKKLAEVVQVSQVTTTLGTAVLNIIGDLLKSQNDLQHVTNSILSITDRVGDKMCFSGESYSTTAPFLALSLVNVDSVRFRGLSFGVSSFTDSDHPQIFINEKIPRDPVAFVYLPPALEDHFPEDNKTKHRVQFQFYKSLDLFRDPEDKKLCTYVVSASVTNVSIRNLQQSITVTLHHSSPILPEDSVQCVYWNFQKNGGQGGWDSQGCRRNSSTANHTSCLCGHLTHFAVLLDDSKQPLRLEDKHILTVITYLGCGISSIFLGISVLTYTAFESLRRDYPSKILINLLLALLGLNLLFLLDSWLASLSSALCVFVAMALHYSLLASFSWMGLEALHMYLALVQVYNIYVPYYVLKLCLLGWGIPLVIVGLVFAVDKDVYGLDSEVPRPVDDSEPFCWLKVNITFYVSVVAYVMLVLLCNTLVFAMVLKQVHTLRAKELTESSVGLLHKLRGAAGLSSLLGLTWALGFFTWGPARVPILYLFSILNTLQGLFIFVFHCLMKENVRKQWRVHLFASCFPLTDYLDQSPSATPARKSSQNQEFSLTSVKTGNCDCRGSISCSCSLDTETTSSVEDPPRREEGSMAHYSKA